MENRYIEARTVPDIRQIVTQIAQLAQNGFRITGSDIRSIYSRIKRDVGFFVIIRHAVKDYRRGTVPEVRSQPFDSQRVIGKTRGTRNLGGDNDVIRSLHGSIVAVFCARSQSERTCDRDGKRDYR